MQSIEKFTRDPDTENSGKVGTDQKQAPESSSADDTQDTTCAAVQERKSSLEVQNQTDSEETKQADPPLAIDIDEAYVLQLLRDTGMDPHFGQLQKELQRRVGGRKLASVERKAICAAMATERTTAAELERHVEDSKREGCEDGKGNCLMLTSYSENYLIGRICEAVNREYAERHGYLFHSDVLPYDAMIKSIAPRSHCTWYKVLMLNRLLSDTQMLQEKGIRYLVWVDADAVVVNRDIRLEEIIEEAKGRDLVIAEDMHEGCLLNAGVMFVRVGEWSRKLWQDVWNSDRSKRFHNVVFYEQSALIATLKARLEGLAHVKPFHSYCGGPGTKMFPHVCVLPKQRLNTNEDAYFSSDTPDSRTEPCSSEEAESTAHAHFIFHPAGSKWKLQALKAVLIGHGLEIPVEAEGVHRVLIPQNKYTKPNTK